MQISHCNYRKPLLNDNADANEGHSGVFVDIFIGSKSPTINFFEKNMKDTDFIISSVAKKKYILCDKIILFWELQMLTYLFGDTKSILIDP